MPWSRRLRWNLISQHVGQSSDHRTELIGLRYVYEIKVRPCCPGFFSAC